METKNSSIKQEELKTLFTWCLNNLFKFESRIVEDKIHYYNAGKMVATYNGKTKQFEINCQSEITRLLRNKKRCPLH